LSTHFKILSWGLIISFLGSLPPGTMTIAATYISAGSGTEAGFIYAAGSMLAEVLVVRLALSAIDRIGGKHKLFFILEIITALVLVAMTIACFYFATQINEIAGTKKGSFLHPFVSGFLLSITNPIHIPFWLGWSIVLMNRDILEVHPVQYNWYVTGIGIGSMLGFTIFIFGGELLLNVLRENQNILLFVTGIALLVVNYFHISKMMAVPASVRYANIFKDRRL
jgi:threonine/homoserine/homoserine lactone efflux protein